MSIREGAKVTRIDRHGRGVRVSFEGPDGPGKVDGSHLLVAVGRKPNLDGLGLEAAGIKFDRQGIKAGANLRTTNRRVYVVGDAAGSAQFTHVAGYHAGIVIRALLFRLPAKADLVRRAEGYLHRPRTCPCRA